jgi:hypothetical protein
VDYIVFVMFICVIFIKKQTNKQKNTVPKLVALKQFYFAHDFVSLGIWGRFKDVVPLWSTWGQLGLEAHFQDGCFTDGQVTQRSSSYGTYARASPCCWASESADCRIGRSKSR